MRKTSQEGCNICVCQIECFYSKCKYGLETLFSRTPYQCCKIQPRFKAFDLSGYIVIICSIHLSCTVTKPTVSDDSDQTGYQLSLIRVIAMCSLHSSPCRQRRLIRPGRCPDRSDALLSANATLLVCHGAVRLLFGR